MTQELTRFSDVISVSIERLFKTGGLALVFIFVGFVAMIFGHFYESSLSSYIFGVGAFLNTVILGFFLYTQIQGTQKARKILKENKELLDTTQDIAIGLTNTISETQSLMFKHAEEIGRILELAVPFISQLPILNKVDLSETLNVNAVIVSTTGRSKEIVDGAHTALIAGDVEELRKYSKDLKKTTEALKQALSKESITQSIPDYNKIIETLQKNLTGLTSTLISTQSIAIDYVERVDTTLNLAVPVLQGVEFLGIGKKLNELGISKLLEFSNQTKDQLDQCKALTDKLNEALVAKDLEATTTALEELKKFSEELNTQFRVGKPTDNTTNSSSADLQE
jgi:uncharacterized membrane protein YciS (DUF1049 family)